MRRSLAALQERFIDAVLDEATLAGIAPADAIDVYRRNARANFHAALASVYPVVHRLVGEAFFAQAARVHAHLHPSRSGDLHGFGAHFAAFLEAYAPAASLPYLPAVARLEWAMHEAFHAADAPVLDFAALAAVAPQAQGGLRLRLAPAVRLVASSHPVLALWEANQPDRDGTPARAEGPDQIVVWRVRFDVSAERVDAASWALLCALRDGATLERATAALGADEARLPSLLAHWVSSGVIASFEAAGPA